MCDDDTVLPDRYKVDYDKYFDLYIERKLILLSNKFEFLFSKDKKLSEFIK